LGELDLSKNRYNQGWTKSIKHIRF
jgi:hypothetical protein